jgi:serine/threonine protein kinase
MHTEPQPIFHRDIRWPNIVKRADDPTKWVLIDWEDAAAPPTLAAKHLDKNHHAPAVFKDNHGPEVDIWAVGMLILQSSRYFPSFPPDLLAVAKSMQSGKSNVLQSIETIRAIRTRTAVQTESTI